MQDEDVDEVKKKLHEKLDDKIEDSLKKEGKGGDKVDIPMDCGMEEKKLEKVDLQPEDKMVEAT